MHKTSLIAASLMGAAAVLGMAIPAFAQANVATDITNAQIQKSLKEQPEGDRTLRVLDMGSYQLSVAVVSRGPTNAPPAQRPAGAAQNQQAAEPCGLTSAPAGAKLGPKGMIAHDDTVETYIVISGSGTLVTGGQILNGRRSGPDSVVTKILNGPSCSGQAVGNFVSRKMNVGDISVIPAGVAHGWTDITSNVTYLSVRPDPKKVLEHGYVNPALK
jgi:mannose-6-phosphate isomerase-like protein (cupin superfamily)